MKRSFADILQSLEDGQSKKIARKLPEWDGKGIEVPSSLNLEQCSSTVTARYKASLAAEHSPLAPVRKGQCPSVAAEHSPCAPVRKGQCRSGGVLGGNKVGMVVADLTGGLGVDSWAFSEVASKVLYNERDADLAAAAARNFERLGATNIEVTCRDVCGEDGHLDANVKASLDAMKPDIIYLDPARRSDSGKKVFLLEDCSPDIIILLPELLQAAPVLMLKLSPMADITMVTRRLTERSREALGRTCLKEIHVVAAEGECKELLAVLDAPYDGPVSIVLAENGRTLHSPGVVEDSPCATLALTNWSTGGVLDSAGVHDQRAFLFEPSAGLMKAGFDKLICQRWPLKRLDRFTHLYFTEEGWPEEMAAFGKIFRILESRPLDKAAVRDVGKAYPRAEVSARNIHMTSEELRARLGVQSGGDIHIFGCAIDGAKTILVCQRVTATGCTPPSPQE